MSEAGATPHAQFDLVRQGARQDGVEIVHYEARYPPGSRVERRMERIVALMFLLSGATGAGFVAVYIWWPHEFRPEDPSSLGDLYNPLLGLTLGLSLFFLGAAIITWAKKLLPHEVAVEHRHDGGSPEGDRRIMGATLAYAGEETGISRRPLLKRALGLGLLPVGLVAGAPIVGALINNPHRSEPGAEGFDASPQDYTGWNRALNGGEPVRLIREDGSPIRPAEVSVAGQVTVFPGIPDGTTNEYADSPVLLIHLREEDAEELRSRLYEQNQGNMVGNFVAYSKVCTHAGCPPSLFEQQTNRLLCPCHQSQFLIADNARPVFGPAARALPMLPLMLDGEGFFVAAEDFAQPVGPSFWER